MGTELVAETSENIHSFGAIKPPAHPDDGDVVSSRNVGKPSQFFASKPPAHLMMETELFLETSASHSFCYQTTSTP